MHLRMGVERGAASKYDRLNFIKQCTYLYKGQKVVCSSYFSFLGILVYKSLTPSESFLPFVLGAAAMD